MSSDVITAVYEISSEDPAGRAVQIAVEQSHELPTEVALGNAIRDSLAHVRSVLQRPGLAALATVDYPADLAGAELGQLLVLLLGNVSLQDGVRLVDVALAAGLAADPYSQHGVIADYQLKTWDVVKAHPALLPDAATRVAGPGQA